MTPHVRWLAGALLAAAWAIPARATPADAAMANAAPAEPFAIEAAYDIDVAGVPAGEVTAQGFMQDGRYRVRMAMRSVGMIDWVLGFRSTAETSGAFAGNAVVPSFHAADNEWMGEVRTVRTGFDARGVTTNEVRPTAEEDGREPVPPERMIGAVDPLSAGLLLAAEGAAQSCRGKAAVFDGRRSYDLWLEGGSDEALEEGALAGTARRCTMVYLRTGGRSANPWLPLSGSEDPQEGAMWFVPAGLPGFQVPARIEADAGIGTAVLTLTSWRVCPGVVACPPQPSPASRD